VIVAIQEPTAYLGERKFFGAKHFFYAASSVKLETRTEFARQWPAKSSTRLTPTLHKSRLPRLLRSTMPSTWPRLPGCDSATWSACHGRHVGSDAIVMTTGKSRHRREVIIPLYADLRALLNRIPKRATTILTSSRCRPWTEDGFGSSFNKAKIDAGMAERDLHFNDLRGTAATKFYIASLPIRVIAEIMGWEEDHVGKIIRRYVGRTAAVKAMIAKLESKQ
jgi:hypothetical protein